MPVNGLFHEVVDRLSGPVFLGAFCPSLGPVEIGVTGDGDADGAAGSRDSAAPAEGGSAVGWAGGLRATRMPAEPNLFPGSCSERTADLQ
jgi:hypothetical protein